MLVSAFFWLAVTLGFASLENFIFEITNSKLFGYYIPEIIGFSYSDSETSKMMGIKFGTIVNRPIFKLPNRKIMITVMTMPAKR